MGWLDFGALRPKVGVKLTNIKMFIIKPVPCFFVLPWLNMHMRKSLFRIRSLFPTTPFDILRFTSRLLRYFGNEPRVMGWCIMWSRSVQLPRLLKVSRHGMQPRGGNFVVHLSPLILLYLLCLTHYSVIGCATILPFKYEGLLLDLDLMMFFYHWWLILWTDMFICQLSLSDHY